MSCAYGGLIVVLTYAPAQQADLQEFSLITQSNLFILTQASQEILTEVPV